MKRLGEIFKDLSKKNPIFKKIYVSTLSKDYFSEVIGNPFNKNCKVVSYKNETIYIECEEQIYATELNFFREKIREELNNKLGINAIRKVVVRKKGGR